MWPFVKIFITRSRSIAGTQACIPRLTYSLDKSISESLLYAQVTSWRWRDQWDDSGPWKHRARTPPRRSESDQLESARWEGGREAFQAVCKKGTEAMGNNSRLMKLQLVQYNWMRSKPGGLMGRRGWGERQEEMGKGPGYQAGYQLEPHFEGAGQTPKNSNTVRVPIYNQSPWQQPRED